MTSKQHGHDTQNQRNWAGDRCQSHLQAERWGAQLFTEDVEEVDFSSRPFTIRSSERTVLLSLSTDRHAAWCIRMHQIA